MYLLLLTLVSGSGFLVLWGVCFGVTDNPVVGEFYQVQPRSAPHLWDCQLRALGEIYSSGGGDGGDDGMMMMVVMVMVVMGDGGDGDGVMVVIW